MQQEKDHEELALRKEKKKEKKELLVLLWSSCLISDALKLCTVASSV